MGRSRGGIQYVEHAEGHGDKMYEAVCALGLEGIVSKQRTSLYRSGPSKTWIKVKNPKAPAATRVLEEAFKTSRRCANLRQINKPVVTRC